MQPSPSCSQLTIDLSAAHSHLSRPSMDSGYASSISSSHPPVPADWMLSRMYESWKIADAAAQRLCTDLRDLAECEAQLREARKKWEAEKSAASKRRPIPRLKTVFRKRSAPTLTVTPFPLSSSTATSQPPLPELEELERRHVMLKSRADATRPAAERLDSCFEELRKVLDGARPSSWRSSHSSTSSHTDSYRKLRKAVATREDSYQSSMSTTKALRRACIAIQSAHYYYKQAMDLLDVVCSPKKSKWEAIVGDEQSRQETYREAAKWAEKAQICFNECLRALTQHEDLLKRDEAEACEDLKAAGLLQAVQLYRLMYGGQVLDMGITQQVHLMMQKQEAVFGRLTEFAVWVQNCAQDCEAVERSDRERRDAARRALVALWVQADEDSETFSLAAPSEHAHVFHRQPSYTL